MAHGADGEYHLEVRIFLLEHGKHIVPTFRDFLYSEPTSYEHGGGLLMAIPYDYVGSLGEGVQPCCAESDAKHLGTGNHIPHLLLYFHEMLFTLLF